MSEKALPPETPEGNASAPQVELPETSASLERPSVERRTLLGEFGAYLMQTKKWWMIPIIVMVLVFSAFFLLVTAMPAVAPFIYPLF